MFTTYFITTQSEIGKTDYGNTARRLLDSLSNIAESVREVSAKPTKIVSNWVADSIAPSYWVSNAEISVSIVKFCRTTVIIAFTSSQ